MATTSLRTPEPYAALRGAAFYAGDAATVLASFPESSVDCCITSPPYWCLRDYDHPDQIGYNEPLERYLDRLVEVFRQVRRVLCSTGTLWINVGDCYVDPIKESLAAGAGLRSKNLVGVPWRLALALQADGWYLRSDVIWHRLNAFPESVADRPSRDHEYLFLLAASERYYYDARSIREPGVIAKGTRSRVAHRNGTIGEHGRQPWTPDGFRGKRTVWTTATSQGSGEHYATYPIDLVEPCVLAGTSAYGRCSICHAPCVRDVDGGDLPAPLTVADERWRSTCSCVAPVAPCVVLDPFAGSGTTCLAAALHGRESIGIDLNPAYLATAVRRLQSGH